MKNVETHSLMYDVAITGGLEISRIPDFFDSFENCDGAYNLHTHSYYEIIWFLEDGGFHTVDFTDYEVKCNSFFFISPGQLHRYEPNCRQKAIVFKFLPEFLNDEHTTEDIFLKYTVFNAFDTDPYVIVSSENDLISLNNIFDGMQRELARPVMFGHHRFMQSLLNMFLIVLERHVQSSAKTPLSATSSIHGYFMRFRQALDKEYKQLHNVKDYAAKLNISTKYLCSLVNECSHRTPLQLINERILLESKRQLRFTNKMIKEIAFDLGFEDPSYFVKQFKRQTGMLPTEFREWDR